MKEKSSAKAEATSHKKENHAEGDEKNEEFQRGSQKIGSHASKLFLKNYSSRGCSVCSRCEKRKLPITRHPRDFAEGTSEERVSQTRTRCKQSCLKQKGDSENRIAMSQKFQ